MSPRILHRALPLFLAGAALAGLPYTASAAQTTQTYNDPTVAHHFIVPPGVTKLFVTERGAQGGNGVGYNGNTGGTGGLGGTVTGTLAVTPGEDLYVAVGGRGGDASGGHSGAGGLSAGGLTGGAPVGGPGGRGDSGNWAAGGGGGASVIADGSKVLLLAGAGGGGGGAGLGGAGGSGGAGGQIPRDGQDGGGATPGAGGRGAPSNLTPTGQGGGPVTLTIAGAGGGGGGGWQIVNSIISGGGGGGMHSTATFGNGGGGGGGAGASFATSAVDNVHYTTAFAGGDGQVSFIWAAPQTTTLLSATTPARAGSPVSLTATVQPPDGTTSPLPTGTVSFLDGSKLLQVVPLGDGGKATFSSSTLAPGNHTITAQYTGDSVYDASASDPRTQEIDQATAFTSPASVSGVVGAPLTFKVATSGFPAAHLVATGSLDGLSFADQGDGTGVLSGTPSASGSFTIDLSAATLSAGQVAQKLTLTVVRNPLAIAATTLPTAFTGQAYAADLSATGGTPGYSWSVASGALPAGLTLNARTGHIGGTPTTAGTATFTVRVKDTTAPTALTATRTERITTQGIAPSVYVTNGANNSVTSYALAAAGNVAPATRLSGLAQGLNAPDGVALTPAGRLYVADSGADRITAYDRGATTPTLTISGPDTGLAGPAGIVLDGSGRLYVVDRPANAVTVYASGASGDATPVKTLAGSQTQLANPAAVTVDGSGNVWVANTTTNTITEYAAGAQGNAAPIATIAGASTGLGGPQALVFDAAGELLVTNEYAGTVTEYAAGAHGNAAPVRSITGLGYVVGIDVDTAGHILVSDQFANMVSEYAPTAAGNAAPIATFAGGATGLAAPGAIAVAPPLSVLTSRLRAARAHRKYRAALAAGEGTSPYRWRLVHGRLPRGLHLSRRGVITGVARAATITHFTVRVTDAAKPATSAKRRLRLVVRGRHR